MKMKILISILFLFFWQHQLSIPRHTPTTIKKLHHSIIVPKVRKNAISNDQDHFAQDVTYMCTTINRTCHDIMYVFKIWTKWRFVIHWDVIMMLLQLQFYCMNMHRVVTTNGSLINWSDDLSPLYYHQNGRPVHFGSISLQVSLLNVYTSMNIEECRTQKDNETSVGSQLASKFGEHLLAGWLDVRYH